MSEIKTHFHISLGIVLPISVQKINISKKSSDITQILKEIKPFLKCTASFRKMVSLFVFFIQIAWIKGHLCRQIKLCQRAYVVARKILQKALGLPIPDCFLHPGQKKKTLLPLRKPVEWSPGLVKLQSALHQSKLVHSPQSVGSTELWQYKMENFLLAYILCTADNVSQKNVSDSTALQSWMFCVFPCRKIKPSANTISVI